MSNSAVKNTVKPEISAVEAIYRIMQSINDYSKHMQNYHGVSGPQLWVLWEIRESSLSMSQIAENAYIHPSTVSGIVNRLEAKGLVKRVHSSSDHRVVHVEATETGLMKMEQAPVPMRRRLVDAMRMLSESDLEKLACMLDTIAKACDKEAKV